MHRLRHSRRLCRTEADPPVWSNVAQRPKTFGETIAELWELLKAYAKQETIDPLKGLGLYLAIGLGAALSTALGVGLLLLGLLRLLQSEAHDWVDASGKSSVAPYLLVFLVSVLLIDLLARRIPKQFGDHT